MNITIKSIGISGLAALLIFGLEACQQRGQNRLHQPQRIISNQIGKKKTEEFNRLRSRKTKNFAETCGNEASTTTSRGSKDHKRKKDKRPHRTDTEQNKEIESIVADVKKALRRKMLNQ